MTGRLLTVKDVTLILQASERFVHDELRRKNLRGSKTGAGWRISEADLDTYIDAKANVSRVRRSA
jgi:excisionase family DNA binding protein